MFTMRIRILWAESSLCNEVWLCTLLGFPKDTEPRGAGSKTSLSELLPISRQIHTVLTMFHLIMNA